MVTNLDLAKQFIREVILSGESADAIEMFAEWLDKRAHEPTYTLPPGFVWVPQCAACGVLDVEGARHFSGCGAFPGELVQRAVNRTSTHE